MILISPFYELDRHVDSPSYKIVERCPRQVVAFVTELSPFEFRIYVKNVNFLLKDWLQIVIVHFLLSPTAYVTNV